MLERFAALDSHEQAERDARDAVLRAALNAICKPQVAWALSTATSTPRDRVVADLAADQLGLDLVPGSRSHQPCARRSADIRSRSGRAPRSASTYCSMNGPVSTSQGSSPVG